MGLNHFYYSNEKSSITRKYIVAKRIITSKDAQNVQCLLNDTPRQATLGKADSCILNKGAYVVLDFGSELLDAMQF